ncbi:MAG: hypothetical protein JXR77_07715, partial [Lentisphaeria bacterium]|nr:hypothetical protein [Lentisphaeria bacterium]
LYRSSAWAPGAVLRFAVEDWTAGRLRVGPGTVDEDRDRAADRDAYAAELDRHLLQLLADPVLALAHSPAELLQQSIVADPRLRACFPMPLDEYFEHSPRIQLVHTEAVGPKLVSRAEYTRAGAADPDVYFAEMAVRSFENLLAQDCDETTPGTP